MTLAFEPEHASQQSNITPLDDLVVVENLSIAFHSRRNNRSATVVSGISFRLRPGRITALIGESGSGKSVTARALVGLNGKAAITSADSLTIQGKSIKANNETQWRHLRGRQIGFILQDALTSLDPLRTIEKEVAEPLVAHGWGNSQQRRGRVIDALQLAGLADAQNYLTRRPDELSGGQRQRALIAQATVLNPPILIADEPTTALDSTVQNQILGLFETLRDRGHAILLITHDLGVVSRLANDVLVMKNGHVIESGTTHQILQNPAHEYTRDLIRAIPNPSQSRKRLLATSDTLARQTAAPQVARPELLSAKSANVAVEVNNLFKSYRSGNGQHSTVLTDISLRAFAGETLGIVGESGSGKSTLSWIIAGLKKFDAGEVKILGKSWHQPNKHGALQHRRAVQVVYQDPLGSFDPRHSVGQILTDALIPDHAISPRDRDDLAVNALKDVSISTELWYRNPLTLSGGQRQRLSIARALITGARLLVLDEPVSALDATIQAQILDLLRDLQESHGLTYIFVSHDLGVVHHISHNVIVLRSGKIMEQGTADQIFFAPQTDYAKALVSAVPRIHSFLDN